MEKFTTRLTIAIMALMVMLSISNQAKAGWYETASEMHKEWAKEFHTEKDSVRYTNVHNDVIGHNVKLKFGTLKFPGIVMQKSLTSKSKNFAEVIGANEIAYNGNTFHSIIVDHSKCHTNHEFSDCDQSMGSSRTELITKSSAYNFTEGKEAWINYAVLPAHNIIFDNRSRTFTVGQCHPLKGAQKITWMLLFRNGELQLKHNWKMIKNNDGNWTKGYETHRTLKKGFKANDFNGNMEWTNIRINFKNSSKPDGKLKIWIDGELKYDYEGPTNWNSIKKTEKIATKRNKCAFKFGLYTNANLTSPYKEHMENMTVFVDYMGFAKTQEKLEKILAKDK
tara:strand:+ start:130 stop:1140 length:1011 start_codon:yes stop_codon:yes gene_type:complete